MHNNRNDSRGDLIVFTCPIIILEEINSGTTLKRESREWIPVKDANGKSAGKCLEGQREAFHSVNKSLPSNQFSSMRELINKSLYPRRINFFWTNINKNKRKITEEFLKKLKATKMSEEDYDSWLGFTTTEVNIKDTLLNIHGNMNLSLSSEETFSDYPSGTFSSSSSSLPSSSLSEENNNIYNLSAMGNISYKNGKP